MKRAHIAFFTFPHAPFLNPALSVIATLVRRGFRVTCVTSERFTVRVVALGAEVVFGPSFPNRLIENDGNGRTAETVGTDFAEFSAATLSRVTPFYEKNRPALIVYDFTCVAARILAKEWQVPAIQTSPGFAFDKLHLGEQIEDADFREAELREAYPVNHLLEKHGVYGDYPFHKEGLNIFFYPKLWQIPGDAFDDTCFYASRCPGEQPYIPTWKPTNTNRRPLILVSTSTYYVQGPAYFRMCIDALVDLQCNVVLAIGDTNTVASLGVLPPNFEILQHIPQIQVLPHADLMICLGGMITTVESIYHGVPLIMITHGFPEPELYAENIVRHRLGTHIRKAAATAKNIERFVVQSLEDGALLNRVKHVQRLIQRDPGGEDTANRIVDYHMECHC